MLAEVLSNGSSLTVIVIETIPLYSDTCDVL